MSDTASKKLKILTKKKNTNFLFNYLIIKSQWQDIWHTLQEPKVHFWRQKFLHA